MAAGGQDSAFGTISGHCRVCQAGRWDENRAHFTVTWISGLMLLPQNAWCLITLESLLISKFSETILPLHTDDWPGDPWHLGYLSAELGNWPGCVPTGPSHGGAEILINVWGYLLISQILPQMHHDPAGSALGNQWSKKSSPTSRRNLLEQICLSWWGSCGSLGSVKTLLSGSLSSLLNSDCGCITELVLWFIFLLHPFYLLGHSFYWNCLFPRNLWGCCFQRLFSKLVESTPQACEEQMTTETLRLGSSCLFVISCTTGSAVLSQTCKPILSTRAFPSLVCNLPLTCVWLDKPRGSRELQ